MMSWFPTFKDYTDIVAENQDARDKASVVHAQKAAGDIRSDYEAPLRALLADLGVPKFDTSSSFGRYLDREVSHPLIKRIMGRRSPGNPRGAGKTRAGTTDSAKSSYVAVQDGMMQIPS